MGGLENQNNRLEIQYLKSLKCTILLYCTPVQEMIQLSDSHRQLFTLKLIINLKLIMLSGFILIGAGCSEGLKPGTRYKAKISLHDEAAPRGLGTV
jgi:hypothetical protein